MTKITFIFAITFLTGCSIQYTENLVDKGFNKECIKEYKKAMSVYNRAIFFNKESALAYWRRGNLYATEAYNYDYNKAIVDLTASIQIDSTLDGGYAYWDRAYCKRQINDTIGALLDYDKAIAINPEKENFYYFRGTLKFYRLHDIEGALRDFDSAIKYWNGYDLARQCRAELKVGVGDFESAMDDYNNLQYRLRDFDSSYADVFYFRGIAKYETGDKNGACEDLTTSNKLGFELAKEKLDKLCK
ncbi:MAG: hypothetical protein IT245_04860 [Bacteroidia bacterium]|nr:hypothetical protein [Bacteroidia bacterium]